MRPFNKTTATLVRPHPFSTLCPTPLGNSPVCFSKIDIFIFDNAVRHQPPALPLPPTYRKY